MKKSPRKACLTFISSVVSMTRLAVEAYPIGFAVTLLLNIILGVLPVVAAWITKLIFDALTLQIQEDSQSIISSSLLGLLSLQAIVFVVSQGLAPVSAYFRNESARILGYKVQTLMYKKISGLAGLAPFEDPEFYDAIQIASDGARNGPASMLSSLITIVQAVVSLMAFAGVLLALSPMLTVLVVVAVIPQLYVQLRMSSRRYDLAVKNTIKERKAFYFGRVLSTVPFAKEIRLFGLADYFLNLLEDTHKEIYESQRRQQKRNLIGQLGLASFTSIIVSIAFLFVVIQAFMHRISIGDVTLYTNAVGSVQSSLFSLINMAALMHENVLFYKHFDRVLKLPQPVRISEVTRQVSDLADCIEIRNLSFRYSASHPWILRNVNLRLPAGKCMALIGLNGAGKTTLVKLLTRLYDPTEGMILWDGVDIRDFDPQELREKMAVIFQDFVHYDLSVRENIGLGNVSNLQNDDAVQWAADQAGISDAIQNLPQGYDTVLSRWLATEGRGSELSGGEWQKVAIARMFMKPSSFMILDEPTAALDAQAEYDLYNCFIELMRGRTSLLITHRFSTARLSHVIAVLEAGRVIEYGSHDTLLTMGGKYSKLYKMQAERYF